MPEQLPLDFTASVSVRMRRAKKVKEQDALQPQLFVAPPNLDVHLHSPSEAVAQIGGSDPDRTIVWLQALVGTVRVIKSKRVAFPTERLDRLLHVRPPAQVTLDAASMAVARSIWAKKLGLKPLKVMRDRQRLYAASQRWPRGFGVTDAPWPAIATLNHLGLPLDIDARAKALMTTKLAGSGSHIATAGLAGSAVMFEARQPTLLENLQLPALAYMGEEGTGMYKMPLLSAECLLTEPSIKLSPDLEQAIKKACAPVKPLKTDESFPWTLYGFQAKDAARGMQILETTGGVLFAGEMGSGKGVPLTEYVLTPSGRTRAGDIRLGDDLIGRDGKPTRVLGVFPQGERPLYRVTFTDHSSALVDDAHLWAVQSANSKFRGRSPKVLTSPEILESGLRDAAGNLRWYIPICEPVQFEGKGPLPLAPYSLGALLGDGGISTNDLTFASVDKEVVEEIAAELGVNLVLAPQTEANRAAIAADRGCDPSEIQDCNYRITGARHVKDALRSLGLLGKRSWEKNVPEAYLYASEADRRALLQGLLDTDGGTKSGGQCSSIEFTSTSEALADAVVWLCQSLGGTARKSEPVQKAYTYKGEKRKGRPAWRLSLQLPDHVVPFRVTRKAKVYRPRVKYQPTRGIVSIEPEGSGVTVCFKVAAEDSLFLLDSAICTHNTTVSLALVHEMDIWPLLVVAPLSAFSTWERQIGEMGRRAYLATEAPAKSWAAIESGDYEAVVISFDRLGAFTEIVERYGFKGIIADEIQRIRTPGSKRSRALRSLAASVPFRMGLSGTPLTNTVQDLLPVGSFLVPGEWKPRANAKDLEDLYPGDPIESVAEHLGTLMVRRRMVDTGAKLPKRNDHRIFVQLTPEQRRALADLEAEAEAAKEAGEFDDVSQKMHAFVRLHRARQIINSPHAAGLGGMNPKVRAAIDVAEDFTSQGRKGVIFCADRQTFRDIGKGLDEVGIGWVGIWGATSSKDRINNEKRFHEDPDVKVVVCTIQAGAESWSASPTGTWLLSTSYMYQAAILEQMECSVPGALVSTDGVLVPVEDVQVGQLVRTHTGALRPVTGVSERLVDASVYAVTFEGESTPRLELTGEHPVRSFSRGFVEKRSAQGRTTDLSPAWFPARLLEPGDYVVVEEDLATGAVNGFPVREVSKVEEQSYRGPVHNFSVEEDESYVLNGTTVHNCRVFRLSSDPDGPDIEIMYLHAQVPGGSLDDRMVEILAVKKALFAQVVDRTVHVDNTKTHYSMSDLVYLLTGKKDERLEKIEADRKAAADREQAMKDHAKKTLYAKKGKNKTSVEAFYDSGEMAKTLEEYLEAEEVEVPKEALVAAGLEDDSEGMDEDFDVEEGDDD